MDSLHLAALIGGTFLVAILYSAVGHGGASGYISVMTLAGIAVTEIRPVSLTLNVFAASIAAWQYYRAGNFTWSLFWPFALLSVPAALIGGRIQLPVNVLKVAIGVVLLVSAARFFIRIPVATQVKVPSRPLALGIGGTLGLLSGLTGTGGGIFLTPTMLFARWAGPKQAAAVSAPFIVVNSLAGIAGAASAGTYRLPAYVPALILAAIVGGFLGSYGGSRKLTPLTVQQVLAVVLVTAGLKLVFG